MIKIKPGCDKHLKIRIPGINTETITALELIIKDSADRNAPVLLKKAYPGEIVFLPEEGAFTVTLTGEETAILPARKLLYGEIFPQIGSKKPAVAVFEMCSAGTLKGEMRKCRKF